VKAPALWYVNTLRQLYDLDNEWRSTGNVASYAGTYLLKLVSHFTINGSVEKIA